MYIRYPEQRGELSFDPCTTCGEKGSKCPVVGC